MLTKPLVEYFPYCRSDRLDVKCGKYTRYEYENT